MENDIEVNENSENIDENNNDDSDNEEKEEQQILVEVSEEEPEVKILDESIISNCISLLLRTSDGMNYAYVQLYCVQKNITDISILSRYIHLRYIDLSNNNISDISGLSNLNDLITLNCSFNRIKTIDNLNLPYLRKLNLSNNKIFEINIISFPELESLNLNGNKITKLYNNDQETVFRSDLLPQLVSLELRGNQLSDTSGLENIIKLKNLFLSKNKITKICGLENLINLEILHLRDNELIELDGFTDDLQSLQYLNLRGNHVTTIEEIRKLKTLSLLRALILSGNPVAELDEYRLETLTTLRKLVRLDKDNFLDEERTEAEQIFKQRLQDEMLENQKSFAEDEMED